MVPASTATHYNTHVLRAWYARWCEGAVGTRLSLAVGAEIFTLCISHINWAIIARTMEFSEQWAACALRNHSKTKQFLEIVSADGHPMLLQHAQLANKRVTAKYSSIMSDSCSGSLTHHKRFIGIVCI